MLTRVFQFLVCSYDRKSNLYHDWFSSTEVIIRELFV